MAYSFGLNHLAELYLCENMLTEAAFSLAGALMYSEKNGDRYCLAETYRLKGDLLTFTNQEEAESCFLQGIAIAEEQGAKTIQLRGTVDLSRLYQKQGKQVEARQLLQPLYEWFTEGFDTVDLQEAKLLLEELGDLLSGVERKTA